MTLLGFELELAKDLPVDPDKPYHFNNTAEFMMVGPDQLVRYKEAARKAMASAIVDIGKPEVHQSQLRSGNMGNQVKADCLKRRSASIKDPGVGRKTVGLKSWPKTGEFRIRAKASGNFPPGFQEVTLQLGYGHQSPARFRIGSLPRSGNRSFDKHS